MPGTVRFSQLAVGEIKDSCENFKYSIDSFIGKTAYFGIATTADLRKTLIKMYFYLVDFSFCLST